MATIGPPSTTALSRNNPSDRIGNISWFGGPHDPTDSGHTASGGTTAQPGIAVYDRSTLGGWWMVKLPNGVITVTKQTDIGPAPSTGRTFDFTYSILPLLGYSEKNFPTDHAAHGIYLGKGPTTVSLTAHVAAAVLGATHQQQTILKSQLDGGALLHGHPIAVAPDGTSHGATNVSGSAVYSPIIPDPGVGPAVGAVTGAFSSVTDFLSYIVSGHFLLLALGGILVVVAVVEIGSQVKAKA